MSNHPWIAIKLIIVTAGTCLVAKEVDVCVFDSVGLFGFSLEMLQTVALVPAVREDIEGDLAADGISSQRVENVSPYTTGEESRNREEKIN